MATRPAPPHAGAAWIVILAGVSAALHVGKLPPALPVLQGELVKQQGAFGDAAADALGLDLIG